jgi:hypothetical protein
VRHLVAALGQQAGREEDRERADRHVDPQDPLPAEVLGEDAAEQDAGRAAGAGHGAPDAERPVALRALGERRGDDGERGGGDQRGAQALEGAGDDEHDVVGRQAADERGDGEDPEPEHEQPAAAQEVGHAAAEQQEAAEDEGVGVDDPREVLAGELELAADGGQRDVHDGGVDHDHELRHREQQQGDVLGARRVEGRHGTSSLADVEFRFRFAVGTIRSYSSGCQCG